MCLIMHSGVSFMARHLPLLIVVLFVLSLRRLFRLIVHLVLLRSLLELGLLILVATAAILLTIIFFPVLISVIRVLLLLSMILSLVRKLILLRSIVEFLVATWWVAGLWLSWGMLPGLRGCRLWMMLEMDGSMLGIHKPKMLNASWLLEIDFFECAEDLCRRVTLVTVKEQVAEIVTKFEWELLSILWLLDRQVLIHGVGRKLIKIAEHLVALDDPSNFEVVWELNRWFFGAHEQLGLIVGIRFTLHPCKPLVASALVDWEYQYHVIGILICILKLLCRPRWRGPHTLIDGCLNALMVEALHNEESGAPLNYRHSSLDLPLYILTVAHNVFVVVTPLRHHIWEGPSEGEVDGLGVLQFV